MKRILPFIFTFYFLLFTLPSAAFAQTATLSLDPSSGTFNKGCTFSLKVNLDTGSTGTKGTETDGTDAILIYDASRLTATSIDKGTIYPDYPGNNIDASSGKITISGLASVSTPFSGTGTLATVNFTVPAGAAAGATQVRFDFDPQKKDLTIDSNVVQRGTVVDVLNSVVDGNYTIGAGSCNAQASSAPTPTPIPAGNNQTSGQNPTIGQGAVGATPSAQQYYKGIPSQGGKTLDQMVDETGKGPGTPQLTFTLAIVGGVLTVLGILGLALL